MDFRQWIWAEFASIISYAENMASDDAFMGRMLKGAPKPFVDDNKRAKRKARQEKARAAARKK